jgi:hypothetical protein
MARSSLDYYSTDDTVEERSGACFNALMAVTVVTFFTSVIIIVSLFALRRRWYRTAANKMQYQ